MKFGTQFTLAALALGASAARLQPVTHVVRSPPSHVERDLATVTSVIADVSSGIKALDKEVSGFSGDDSAMNKAAASLISTLKAGASTVDDSSDLSLTDALGLTSVVEGLQADSDVLVDDLSSKKADFEEAGMCSTVRQQTSDISNASKDLIKAIVSKVPEAAQGIAEDLASGLKESLEKAESEFAEGNCVDKAGGGGGDDTTTTSAGGGDGGSETSTAAGPGETTSAGDGGEDGETTTTAAAPTTSAGDDGGAGYPTESSSAPAGDYPTESPSAPTPSFSAIPLPTGGNNGTTTGPAPSPTSPVTAGAAVVAGPLGAAMVAVAAALL